jgi:hypothetical protein
MRVIAGLLTLIMIGSVFFAADAEQEWLANSAEALEEILNIPDALPKELLNKAECVAVMPSFSKAPRYVRTIRRTKGFIDQHHCA